MRVVRLLWLVLLATGALAQESPSPTPSPERAIPLRFAPPPMEGTISLGIYDAHGKLVRVLHREDAIADFTAGHDALETTWDGKDESGQAMPPGKYSARGYLVGKLGIDGVGYYFNDWVTDEKSPHVLALETLRMDEGHLRITAELPGHKSADLLCDETTGAVQLQSAAAAAPAHCAVSPAPVSIVAPIDCARGRNATLWYIDALHGNGPREVKQVAPNAEVLRRLGYTADDPQPQKIEASPSADRIFLFEKNDRLQRLRALTLVNTTSDPAGAATSDWKTDFEKKIVAHQNFAIVAARPVPVAPNDAKPLDKVRQQLVANPLEHDHPTVVDLAVGIDKDGSFLETADHLPLRTISETPQLTRSLFAPDGANAIDVFEDDGAVVAQFRVSGLDQMMAFNCGECDLK